MAIHLKSPCKVNLLLNILGKRPDGFHELETIMQPVSFYDELHFELVGQSLQLICSEKNLPADSRNLVHRAASVFLAAARINEGVKIHLEKRIPLAAGLGGGSGNAATTLRGLNLMFGSPFGQEKLSEIAASLGSDINFFLQDQPGLATGRGENVVSLPDFAALKGRAFFLFHPGFGISTPWAYQNLARFPEALNGRPGRAQVLARLLESRDLKAAASGFYNSLEAPALDKYPILKSYQEFLTESGAYVSLMSGSGSTTFAITETVAVAEEIADKFRARYGNHGWHAVVPI